ncbi:MAG: tetratricopeptide repeat protein [Anaerolineae bacterium]|nr:tetratricopeptide repeat protein [Anaerolineae bacterium]
MSQKQEEVHDLEEGQGVPWAMIAAVAFLVISLVVSGMLLTGMFDAHWTVAEIKPPTQTPEASQDDGVEVEDTPEPAAEEPGEQLGGTLIGLAPLGQDAPDLKEQLTQALQNVQTGASLPNGISVREVTLPPERASAEEIDVIQDAPEVALLIVWERAEDGLVRFYLMGAPDAPVLGIGDTPAVWDVSTPEKVSFYVTETDATTLPAGLAIGLLEVSAGAIDQAAGRFQTLQSLPSTISLDQLGSNQAVLMFAVGRAQTAGGSLTEALQTYSQALKLQEDFAAAAINRGNIYLKLGDAGAALNAYGAAEASGLVQAISLYNQTLAYYLANDLDTALAVASQLVEMDPGVAWRTNLRGYIYYLRGEYEAAHDDFASASRSAPDIAAMAFNRAWTLIALADYEQALAVFDDLLELEPDNPSIYLQQGRAFQANGDIDRAEAAFTQAIELDPAYLDAYLLRAWLYCEADESEQAQADAERAIEINPDDGRAYQIIGDILTDEEAFDSAKDAYTDAIDRGISTIEVYAARGWARQRIFYTAGAIEDYEQALALGSEDTTLLFRLGFALFEAGRFEDALEAASGAVNGGLDTAEAHALLALTLDTDLQREEAEQEYQKAIDLEPGFEERDFLEELPLWSDSAITRAMSITRRLGD